MMEIQSPLAFGRTRLSSFAQSQQPAIMQRLSRPLYTGSKLFRPSTSLLPAYSIARILNYTHYTHCQLTDTRSTSSIYSIPNIPVPGPSLASDSSHLDTVNRTLQNEGILHMQLAFSDDKSRYIQNLLLNLHKNHAHGLPLTHSANRGWMWDIRPSADSFQSNNHQARSETTEEFPWHTDCSYEAEPPRFFALQVLHPDQCGGGTLSVLNVDQLLTLLSPFAREWLFTPNYRIAVPPEFIKSQGETEIVGNLLTINPNSNATQLRFREDIVTPLCEEAAKALAELKSVLLGPAAKERILNLTPEMLPRGSIILMDNGRWLHARNEVKDPNRHLRRVRWDARKFCT
jgi:alpha-ketoglutarate-dependent taurine dioxygenase